MPRGRAKEITHSHIYFAKLLFFGKYLKGRHMSNYQHPDDLKLFNLHQTMQYNPLGQPEIRVAARFGAGGDPAVGGGGNINASTDAFGRLRVSSPYTLFDSQNRYRLNDKFSYGASGSGSATYLPNESSVRLSCSGAGNVIAESKRVFAYQPGKSLLIYNTFVFNQPTAGVTQRVGYFGAQNGIYLELENTTLKIVRRSSTSGSVIDTAVSQSNWNVDKMDGTGPSGLIIDISKAQILFIDIEWLGVGSVRTGFVINGNYYITHVFNHANLLDGVYMTTARLPIRYEISSTGPNANMKQICSSVISEGGYNAANVTETAGLGTSTKRLTTLGTYYPMVSIRLNANRLDSIVLPRQVDVLSPTVNYYRWVLVSNATLIGATWAGISSTGTVDYDIASTGMSGGVEIQSGYISSREMAQLGADAFQFQLGRSVAGISDTVTLALSATANNADVLAQIGWEEIV
jgi:hypothetical protein